MSADHLSEQFRNAPYWHDTIEPLTDEVSSAPDSLPANVEVAVIGAGFTGLSAALELARGGRDVIVLDKEGPGGGCSSRNGGLIGPSYHKLGLDGLAASHGVDRMHNVLAESRDSLEFLVEFIANEGIDCDLRRSGRFRGADRPQHYENLAREVEGLRSAVGLDADMVPRAEQRAEIGSDAYHGGAVYHRDGHLNPG